MSLNVVHFLNQESSVPDLRINKLEVHYYLKDDSHFMDAFVRHKCEAEILAIAKEIAETFNIKIGIENEAFREGGLKELWKFLGKNSNQITLILTVITVVLSRIPVSNGELEDLQKENLRLQNEEKKLQIEKLKQELNHENLKVDDTTIKEVADVFDTNYKIIKHVSNFYQSLNPYERVTKISSTVLLEDNTPATKPVFVDRDQFTKFILASDELPDLNIENAVIEIISPVLRPGTYKWKGIYEGRTMDFFMKDEKYKESVIKKEVTFQSGYAIECILTISRKMDDLGNIQNTSYAVSTVIGETEGNSFVETEQGKKYKQRKKDVESQLTLEFET